MPQMISRANHLSSLAQHPPKPQANGKKHPRPNESHESRSLGKFAYTYPPQRVNPQRADLASGAALPSR